MYKVCFGLSKRPFLSVAQPDQFFPAASIEAARQTLIRCIERAEGAAVVVGPSGTGKTLLCRMLAAHFQDSFEVALLSRGRLSTARALWQAILFELRRPYRQMDEGELRLALVDYLTVGEDAPSGLLLLVDEAHTFSLRLLEEIRTITNLVSHGQPGVRLVLMGGPVLEERFTSPKLESFSQRISARCYLEAFNRSETQEYIHSQIHWAGGSGENVFSAEACSAVYDATDGVPRLINQVCDHALLLAYTKGQSEVVPAGVEESWADLQQLPTPWSEESEEAGPAGGIIEFGGLDDESASDDESAADEEPSVAMLRVAPESGQPICEPGEQIEKIQEVLENLDEEFQPIGSIGPEAELAFDDPASVFTQEFAEEEVVEDRCEAPCGKDPPGAGPPVEDARQTVSSRGEASKQAAAPEDGEEEMIIVEDDYDDGAARHKHVVTAVRRQEYTRLFATLRRGG